MPNSSLGQRLLCILALCVAPLCPQANHPAEPLDTLHIDARAAATPFPHFWEQTFGSGRAALALREDYLSDVTAVKSVADFRYVRFHAILHDELGVYNEDENGKPIYNFSLVDRIYDSLLKRGVRPFVEISFMPRKLASTPMLCTPSGIALTSRPPRI